METKLQVSKNVAINKPDEKRQGMKGTHGCHRHDAKGRAVFVQDEQVDGTPYPGIGELAFLWNADEPATYPNAGNNPAAPGIFPPVGGIRYIIGTYLPGVIAPEPTPEIAPRGWRRTRRSYDGFHRTDTTDFGVLLSGQHGTRARRWRGGGAVLPRCPNRERNSAPLARRWGRCRPPWLLSSSEPAAIRFRPARELATAMTRKVLDNGCSDAYWDRMVSDRT